MVDRFEELDEFEEFEAGRANVAVAADVIQPADFYLDLGSSPCFCGRYRRPTSLHLLTANNHVERVKGITNSFLDVILPRRGNILIHFDSFPDLLPPVDMFPDEDKMHFEELYLERNQHRWILPYCFNGVFKRIIWVRPPWSSHFDKTSFTFRVGYDRKDGMLKVDSKEHFFLAGDAWAPTEDLGDAKVITLDCITAGNELLGRFDPVDEWKGIFNKEETYCMHVDLEFFRNVNFYLLMSKTTRICQLVKKIYKFAPPESTTDEDAKLAVERRKKQLAEIQRYVNALAVYKKMPPLGGTPPTPIYEMMTELIEEYRKNGIGIEDVDWYRLNQNAQVFEHSYNELAPEQMDKLFQSFQRVLRSVGKYPNMMIVSKYSKQEFADIKGRLLAALQATYRVLPPRSAATRKRRNNPAVLDPYI